MDATQGISGQHDHETRCLVAKGQRIAIECAIQTAKEEQDCFTLSTCVKRPGQVQP